MMKVPIRSDPVTDHPQFAVLIPREPWVFSSHVVKYDAVHNAKLMGGTVAPIDWVGNEMILPVHRIPRRG